MKWIVKIVVNKLAGTKEIHPPYDLNDDVRVPKLIGNLGGYVFIEFYEFNTKIDAEEYFQSFDVKLENGIKVCKL